VDIWKNEPSEMVDANEISRWIERGRTKDTLIGWLKSLLRSEKMLTDVLLQCKKNVDMVNSIIPVFDRNTLDEQRNAQDYGQDDDGRALLAYQEASQANEQYAHLAL
jgi:hypothetical protein